jgi:diguanylate cyclase (GGDEF)-like protein
MKHLKLTLGTKILLGYLPILILLIAISIFTLLRLNLVNRINSEIVSVDLVENREAENMIDIMLTQESFGQRYMILKSQDMLSLFWMRDQEFETAFKKIKSLPGKKATLSLSTLEQLHGEYNQYFRANIDYMDSPESHSYILADSLRRDALNSQISVLKGLVSGSKKSQMDKTWRTAELGRLTFRTVSIVSLIGIIIAAVIALAIIRGIVWAIKTLKSATDFVSQGDFKNLPTVENNDELGDLSSAFNVMATRLQQLEEIYMDSSPLTRLPGGIAIENEVKKRIEINEPFAFCMFDLDNFKPFNDRYGYSRGNAVIKNTAKILLESALECGLKTDFVGHIGGDDFTLITAPENYEKICNLVIEKFDTQIVEFYNPEERDAGFILSINRQGKRMTFPIMTISIAALDSTKSFVENYIEVGEIIAELKKFAKSKGKSNLVIDRRGGKKREPTVPV